METGEATESGSTPDSTEPPEFQFTREPKEVDTNAAAFVDGLLAGLLTRQQAINIITKDRSSLLAESSIDNLTGLLNRRAFEREYARTFRLVERAQAMIDDPEKRGGDSSDLDYVILFIDGDKFKSVNDTYGHHAGDILLKVMARAIGHAATRPGDIAARYGGEEFVVVLPRTAEENALIVAERIHETYTNLQLRANLEDLTSEQQPEEDPRLRLTPDEAEALRQITELQTLSIGVRHYRGGDTKQSLIKAADDAVYQAKAVRADYRAKNPDAEPYGFTVINRGAELFIIANPKPGMELTPPST